MARHSPRPRRAVSRSTLLALRPVLRFSATRDAYVLRIVGNRLGPVLQLRPPARAGAQHAVPTTTDRGASVDG
jgi:hypothetical protein